MKQSKSILFTFLGTLITGMGIGVFLTPNKIVGGGVSGIATILFHSLGVQPGISFAIINVVLLILGLRVLGKSFTLKTLFGAGMLSIFVQLFSYVPFYTDDTFLATVVGGALYGIGIGLGFAAGASTGGTDILGRLIQNRFPSVPIGKLVLAVDIVVIVASFVAFGQFELTLVGVISLLISSFAIDTVIAQFNVSKIAFVITDKGEDISKNLVSTSPRGVTIIDVVGAYTFENKKMLFCALKESEIADFQRKILSFDPEAFIVFSESQKIQGNGFYLYK